jgi:hypothetical protein
VPDAICGWVRSGHLLEEDRVSIRVFQKLCNVFNCFERITYCATGYCNSVIVYVIAVLATLFIAVTNWIITFVTIKRSS